MSLGQIGEFSFVLASVAVAAGTIDDVLFTAIIAAVALSITASSILVRLVPVPPPPNDAQPPIPVIAGGGAATG